MGTVTAKQLKQRTGEVLRRIRGGERLTLTYRGRPIAHITPAGEGSEHPSRGGYGAEEAWKEIETALRETEPRFEGWREATRWARKRT